MDTYFFKQSHLHSEQKSHLKVHHFSNEVTTIYSDFGDLLMQILTYMFHHTILQLGPSFIAVFIAWENISSTWPQLLLVHLAQTWPLDEFSRHEQLQEVSVNIDFVKWLVPNQSLSIINERNAY